MVRKLKKQVVLCKRNMGQPTNQIIMHFVRLTIKLTHERAGKKEKIPRLNRKIEEA